MIYNPRIEQFLSSNCALETTKCRIEKSRSALNGIGLISSLRDVLLDNVSPNAARIKSACREYGDACIHKIIEEFGVNITSDSFFVFPMQGHSTEFAQRIVIESNTEFDASIDIIDAHSLKRYKQKSKENLQARGIPFYGRKTYTYVLRSSGLRISHWAHDANMVELRDTACYPEGMTSPSDGCLIEKAGNRTFMFESADSNAILITIEIKREPYPAQLIFSALDKKLKFQNPADEVDSRVQLMLSLLSRMGCRKAIPLMKTFLFHPRHYLRWHAMQAILALDALEVLENLQTMAEEDESAEVRRAANQTLAMINEESNRYAY